MQTYYETLYVYNRERIIVPKIFKVRGMSCRSYFYEDRLSFFRCRYVGNPSHVLSSFTLHSFNKSDPHWLREKRMGSLRHITESPSHTNITDLVRFQLTAFNWCSVNSTVPLPASYQQSAFTSWTERRLFRLTKSLTNVFLI